MVHKTASDSIQDNARVYYRKLEEHRMFCAEENPESDMYVEFSYAVDPND